jgi:hypothetical protein
MHLGIIGILAIAGLILTTASYCQQEKPSGGSTGSINGQVIDALTKAPILGASILVKGTSLGDASDEQGRFKIDKVPVGTYVVTAQAIGYTPTSLTDIIVRPKRITHIEAKLQQSAVKLSQTTVKADYFVGSAKQPVSSIKFSAEEIRRSPGSAGDVSRIVSIMPSVAKVNDQMNSLVVRGGTPRENGFYLDNIEIPNINHYPTQGSSGGPIGLLNTDFIKDAQFSAGGFAASYGDRLSSIMDLKFREGNRQEFDGQIDLHFAGFGVAAEGPIGKRGSWLLSVRRSFLDLLVDAIGTGVAPRYSDYQGKVVYDLSTKSQLTFLGVAGIDYIEIDKEQAAEDGNIAYGKYDGYEYTVGVNWRYLWGDKGYSNTSLAFLETKFKETFFETKSDILLSDDDNLQQSLQLRNVNVYQFSESGHIDFGIDAKHLRDKYDVYTAEYTNPSGDTLPPLFMDEVVTSFKGGVFADLTIALFGKLSITPGLRYDYFEYINSSNVSPRLSLKYRVSDRVSLTGATGLYVQNLSLGLLTQHKGNKDLKDPRAMHYVLGTEYLFTEYTKMTVEAYYKDYQNFPLDPNQPGFFIADEAIYRGFVGNYENLVDDGVAESYGIEMVLQKKLVQGVYGLLCGSFFQSRYEGLDGVRRDRVVNNQVILGIEGGYKPNEKWEFSTRWIFAGGRPYTPLDLEASGAINRSVLDINRINEERHPDYHSLNLRVDRRFHFKASNLIVYFSVWNAYDRKNVYSYYWNEVEQKPDVTYQWGMLPIFGLEYEF